ncbi:MAG: acetylglutamate kinase [Pseudomonadota bacterium]
MTDDISEQKRAERRAETISRALPYMQRYDDQNVVIKFGGNAMVDDTLFTAFAEDVTMLSQSGVNPVVVHGGGPQIGNMLDQLGIVSEFRDGLRVTTRETVQVVEMVLAGSINKTIVASITGQGGYAVGLCGKDGGMVTAEKMRRTSRDPGSNIEQIIDLGFVGEPARVDTSLLHMLAAQEIIPVVAPVAAGVDGETYNINADTFAGALAGAYDAKRLLFLTDVSGVLDGNKKLIKQLTVSEARALIADGTISGGMIPKVETCINALSMGVEGVVIVNGTVPHAVLLELFTDHGAGTLIVPDDHTDD